ncbi:MAG: hypothetical protein CVV52_03610 [Spirochaetae bacterium HGW-Spirochaetae-8]|jgi:hypothetical protein|nr:MAG: hypothetical protein CVV52_03610 [Spirochaetae bacterium HGW-Spirochaetae-8]
MIDSLVYLGYYENQEGVFTLRRLLPELLIVSPQSGIRSIAKQRMTNRTPRKGKDLADSTLARFPSGTQQNFLYINLLPMVDYKASNYLSSPAG